jgi:splicing factor 3A subunit 3
VSISCTSSLNFLFCNIFVSRWRHSYGMKCLKIPNTPEMKGVTRIADAIELYEKFKSRDVQRLWNPEQDEEYEDKDGNVFNKKTYDDMVRQGIL